jgi:hypothetical protein
MNIRTFLSGAAFFAVVAGGFTGFDAATPVVPEPGDLRAAGTVDFPVSCTPAVQAEFTRGVALLHSFFYEEARRFSPTSRRRIRGAPWRNGESP